MVQKLLQSLKLTTDKQDKNNMPLIIWSRGIKITLTIDPNTIGVSIQVKSGNNQTKTSIYIRPLWFMPQTAGQTERCTHAKINKCPLTILYYVHISSKHITMITFKELFLYLVSQQNWYCRKKNFSTDQFTLHDKTGSRYQPVTQIKPLIGDHYVTITIRADKPPLA